MEVIRARYGKAVHLKEGQHIKVINTHGTQVCYLRFAQTTAGEHQFEAWLPGDVAMSACCWSHAGC